MAASGERRRRAAGRNWPDKFLSAAIISGTDAATPGINVVMPIDAEAIPNDPAILQEMVRELHAENDKLRLLSMRVEFSPKRPTENSPLRFDSGLVWQGVCHGARSGQGTRTEARAADGSHPLTAPARRGRCGFVGTKGVPTIDHASGGSNKGRHEGLPSCLLAERARECRCSTGPAIGLGRSASGTRSACSRKR